MPYYNYVEFNPSENQVFVLGLELPQVTEGIIHLTHHDSKSSIDTPSVCEQALTCSLPPRGSVVAVGQFDIDTYTAVNVLEIRAVKELLNRYLIKEIGFYHRYGPLMKSSLRFPNVVLAIAYRSSKRNISDEDKVRFIRQAILGKKDIQHINFILKEQNKEFENIKAESNIRVVIPEKLVFIESAHPSAIELAYEYATTVFSYSLEVGRYTISRYNSHIDIDMEGLFDSLSYLEEGWMNVNDALVSAFNSRLYPDKIVDIIRNYIQ